MLVGGDFGGGDAQLQAIAETIAEEDEALGIVQCQGPEEHAFNEGKDGSGGSDAQRKSEHDRQGKDGRFSKLTEGDAKVAHGSEDTSPREEGEACPSAAEWREGAEPGSSQGVNARSFAALRMTSLLLAEDDSRVVGRAILLVACINGSF